MTQGKDVKASTRVRSGTDPITAYAAGLSAGDAAICRAWCAEIDGALPGATSRVWHGAPVWFVGDTPVVGYDAIKAGGVRLLFWNGKAFGDSTLTPIGKFQAAHLKFDAVAEIDATSLRRLLKRAGKELWDHSTIRGRKAR